MGHEVEVGAAKQGRERAHFVLNTSLETTAKHVH